MYWYCTHTKIQHATRGEQSKSWFCACANMHINHKGLWSSCYYRINTTKTTDQTNIESGTWNPKPLESFFEKVSNDINCQRDSKRDKERENAKQEEMDWRGNKALLNEAVNCTPELRAPVNVAFNFRQVIVFSQTFNGINLDKHSFSLSIGRYSYFQ